MRGPQVWTAAGAPGQVASRDPRPKFRAVVALSAGVSSKNIRGSALSMPISRTRAPRPRVSASSSDDFIRRSASRSRACVGSGHRASIRCPAGVRLSSRRRASRLDAFRAISLRSARRRTTTDTELWSVSVRSANSFKDDALRTASACSTKSCAPLMPALRSASRALRRRSRTMRRRASRTLRMLAVSRSGVVSFERAARSMGPH